MPAQLQPIKQFPCTFEGCAASFDTKEQLHSHKKRSDDHDYCSKCKLDFQSYDDLARHKAFAPVQHGKACRVCGEEFKSTSGLRRHIELSHKVKQNLPCVGCGETFPTPALFIEHLEFDHCEVIDARQFTGHVIHKHLIAELLEAGSQRDRFMQKISQHDATIDQEEGGGVGLADVLDDDVEGANQVDFEAIKPVVSGEVRDPGPFPPLASQHSNHGRNPSLVSGMDRMSLAGSISETVVGSTSSKMGMSAEATQASRRQPKAWIGRCAKELFPQAKPTPPPSQFSIENIDRQTGQEHGFNMMNTRFWDPLSSDYDPERFFNTVIQKYFCPFHCEQSFDRPVEMREHILNSHRVIRAKCPYCLKYFDSITALMNHCQSRGSKCQVNKADDFNIFLDRLTGGFLEVKEKTRPDHMQNETVDVKDPETGLTVKYTPPVATYLEYSTCKPSDWKEPTKVAAQIGGFRHKNYYANW